MWCYRSGSTGSDGVCPDLGDTVLCDVTSQVALSLMEWDHV